ncbi:hypothetical protein Syun_020876 [Stephania yunnanensis]|uniref:Uncharacterized protein n=1 Tax=Stephania yunnanensis TaxID=152371 RepID=A0AAP0IEM8_9MAGN
MTSSSRGPGGGAAVGEDVQIRSRARRRQLVIYSEDIGAALLRTLLDLEDRSSVSGSMMGRVQEYGEVEEWCETSAEYVNLKIRPIMISLTYKVLSRVFRNSLSKEMRKKRNSEVIWRGGRCGIGEALFVQGEEEEEKLWSDLERRKVISVYFGFLLSSDDIDWYRRLQNTKTKQVESHSLPISMADSGRYSDHMCTKILHIGSSSSSRFAGQGRKDRESAGEAVKLEPLEFGEHHEAINWS